MVLESAKKEKLYIQYKWIFNKTNKEYPITYNKYNFDYTHLELFNGPIILWFWFNLNNNTLQITTPEIWAYETDTSIDDFNFNKVFVNDKPIINMYDYVFKF